MSYWELGRVQVMSHARHMTYWYFFSWFLRPKLRVGGSLNGVGMVFLPPSSFVLLCWCTNPLKSLPLLCIFLGQKYLGRHPLGAFRSTTLQRVHQLISHTNDMSSSNFLSILCTSCLKCQLSIQRQAMPWFFHTYNSCWYYELHFPSKILN